MIRLDRRSCWILDRPGGGHQLGRDQRGGLDRWSCGSFLHFVGPFLVATERNEPSKRNENCIIVYLLFSGLPQISSWKSVTKSCFDVFVRWRTRAPRAATRQRQRRDRFCGKRWECLDGRRCTVGAFSISFSSSEGVEGGSLGPIGLSCFVSRFQVITLV